MDTRRDASGGFTLIELLIYSVVFASVSITLVYFLTMFFRVSGYQTSTAEVASQANFILGRIEREISQASIVVVNNGGDDETDDTLSQPHARLVIKSPLEDIGAPNDTMSPISIYKNASSVAVIKTGNGPEVPLSNASVTITNLTFTKVSTPPGKDVVLVDLTVKYVSPDPKQQISRQFILGVGKASAATFDTDLKPASTNARDIGTSGLKWKSIYLANTATIDGAVAWTTGGTNTLNNSIGFLKHGLVSVDPLAIAAGANATTIITSTAVPELAGIQVGDRIMMTAPEAIEDGLLMMGATAGANSITVRVKNVSAASINGIARNWSYFVVR